MAGCLSNGLGPGSTGEFNPDIERSTRLGGADPLTIETRPERDYEYIDANDMVHIRYDSGETGKMPFAEWGTRQAAEAARTHVISIYEQEGLGEDGIGVGTGREVLNELDDPPPESAFHRAVAIGVKGRHMTLYSRSGKLLNEPTVDFETVVAATPRSADVTMLFDDRRYTAILPIVCERGWLKQE